MTTPDPEQSIGFLMHDVARLMRREFNRAVQTLGLTEAQWRVIAQLFLREGINQTTLAGILDVQPISLGRLIDRMEQAGFVERRPDPNDRRAQCLYLTDKVAPLTDQLIDVGAQLRETTTQGLTDDQQQQMIAMLHIMRANLNTEGTAAND